MIKPKFINIDGRLIDLSIPKVMGIINVTPDSFYSGSRIDDEKNLCDRVASMLQNGADIIDIGGCSTRPNAEFVSEEEELSRCLPAISLVRKSFPDVIISVDTFRSVVAREAVNCGAQIINDISCGLLDDKMFEVVGELKIPYVLSHWLKEPIECNGDVYMSKMIQTLGAKVTELQKQGVKDIILDPGFGFGKTLEQNFLILNNLDKLQILDLPLLVGVSRKSMIFKTLKTTHDTSLNGTTSLNTIALMKGANIIRVHDVKEASEVVQLFLSLRTN